MKTLNPDILKYETLVFDCDGVVLNSNKIKTQAFFDVAKVYGNDVAQALKDYHVQNGGISRYKKFEYLLTDILKKEIEPIELNSLLEHFAKEVKKALLVCEVAEGLEELRQKTKQAKWLIVSGGDQAELREVFAERGLDKYFDGGIFGSPDTKDIILAREETNQNITRPSLFLGDSKYDYQAAHEAGLDFVFISEWTEVKEWQDFCNTNNLNSVRQLQDLNNISPVTVITASYNSELYLRETVESVARQTLMPLEHLIIDDCSTDNSLALAKQLEKEFPHVRVIEHKENKGLPTSLNTCIRAVKTDYIAILDSDDIALPKWLELTIPLLEVDSSIGLVGGGGIIMSEKGEVTGHVKYCDQTGDVTDGIKKGQYLILHPGTVFRTQIIREIGGYREDLKSTEDNDMYISVAALSRLVNVGEPLIFYRRMKASESRITADYRNLISEYIQQKVALLAEGYSINKANQVLQTIVVKMRATPRLESTEKGAYEHEMGTSFFTGKQYLKAVKYFWLAFMAGHGVQNLRWIASIFKNKLLNRY